MNLELGKVQIVTSTHNSKLMKTAVSWKATWPLTLRWLPLRLWSHLSDLWVDFSQIHLTVSSLSCWAKRSICVPGEPDASLRSAWQGGMFHYWNSFCCNSATMKQLVSLLKRLYLVLPYSQQPVLPRFSLFSCFQKCLNPLSRPFRSILSFSFHIHSLVLARILQ